MLVFNKKKAMSDFYDRHKEFLYWYLTKHTNISERLYYLLMQHIVKCLMQDIEKLIRFDEREQRKWIMRQIDDFAVKEKQQLRRHAYERE